MLPHLSHSALDELFNDRLETEETPFPFDAALTVDGGAGDNLSPTVRPRAGGHPRASARSPAAVWLPAPDSGNVSKQQSSQSAALRQRSWPPSTSGAAWVGDPPDVELQQTAKGGGSRDASQLHAPPAPAVSAAPRRKPKAAWRPCYQSVMKVCLAGHCHQACCSNVQ